MKAQIRMIIASVIVIALALTAVSGITYSWFSDTEQSDITITTGKIDLDAKYSDVQVKSYGDTEAKDVTLNGVDGTTTTLAGNVKATTSDTATDGAAGSQLAITFSGAAPGDEITFNMAVTLVNTIYVTYKQSIIMDSEAPFTITGFENKTLKGTAVGNDGLNSTSYYMLGTETSGAQVTIKFNESADVSSYGDKQYTIILAVQAIQMNVEPAEIAATKTISLGTAGAETVLTVKSAENTADITVTLPTTTKASSGTASSVSVTAKALTAAEVKADTTMSAVTSEGSVLAGVEISKSVEIEPGTDGETQQYFKITMNVGTLSDAQQTALKVYHSGTEVKKSGSQASGAEYYTYADGVITIYALSFSPFVVIDGCEAAIGSVPYATLADAINGAISGQTISLIKDVATTKTLEITGKSISLDLNGKEVTFTGITNTKGTDGEYAGNITVADGAELYVTGATGSKINFSETFGFKVIGTLVIDGDAEFEMTMTEQESDGDKNVIVCMALTESNPSVTINSGTFKGLSDGAVVYSKYGGSVKIYGGEFSGTAANSANGWLLNQNNNSYGTITVYGGTFTNYNPANGDDKLGGTFLATGYGISKTTEESDVIYTVQTCAAKIGDRTYSTIAEAYEAYTESDYTNGVDLDLFVDWSPSPQIEFTKDIIIDLNGNTYYFTKSSTGGYQTELICNFTLKNGNVTQLSNAAFGYFTIEEKSVTVNFTDLIFLNEYGGMETALAVNLNTNKNLNVKLNVSNCIFNNKEIEIGGTDSGSGSTVITNIKSCTFNTGNVEIDANENSVVTTTIESCTFNNGKISIDSDNGSTVKTTITKCAFNSPAYTKNSDCVVQLGGYYSKLTTVIDDCDFVINGLSGNSSSVIGIPWISNNDLTVKNCDFDIKVGTGNAMYLFGEPSNSCTFDYVFQNCTVKVSALYTGASNMTILSGTNITLYVGDATTPDEWTGSGSKTVKFT